MALEQEKYQEIQKKIILRALQDEAFKQKLLNNPKQVIEEELCVKLSADLQINVVQETPNSVYLVLPHTQVQTENQKLSPEEMDIIAGGTLFNLIGSNPWGAPTINELPRCKRTGYQN